MGIAIPKIILYVDIKYIDNSIIELADKRGYKIYAIERFNNASGNIQCKITLVHKEAKAYQTVD